MKTKKIILGISLALILLPGLLYISAAVYVLRSLDIEYLMVSTPGGALHIPRQVIREWIYAFRGSPEDVEAMHSSIGIGWVFATPREDWEKMARFWLDKGVDINHRDARTSFTALHGTALGGELEETRLLLKLGADPMLRDRRGLTALELAELRLAKYPNQASDYADRVSDYTATINLLKNAQTSGDSTAK